MNSLETTDPDGRFRVSFSGAERDTLRVEPVGEQMTVLVERSEDLIAWDEIDSEEYVVEGDVIEVRVGEPSPTAFYRVTIAEGDPAPVGESFVLIPAGAFLMGSPEEELGRYNLREAQREITLTRDFYISNTEVTWSLWNEVRSEGAALGYTDIQEGQNGSNGDEAGQHPVVLIDWWSAIKWCNLRSELEGKTPVYYSSAGLEASNVLRTGTPAPFVNWNALGYRLPTEAEWEFAGRAGTTTAFQTGEIAHIGESPLDPNLDLAGWYRGNSGDATHPIGQKQPNAWGLYDMHGNVSEWCWDWYNDNLGPTVIDPTGASTGPNRSVRGGSWYSLAGDARSAFRVGDLPINSADDRGLRLARSAEE